MQSCLKDAPKLGVKFDVGSLGLRLELRLTVSLRLLGRVSACVGVCVCACVRVCVCGGVFS